MSGIISLKEYRYLNPSASLDDAALTTLLARTQSTVEDCTGLRFGAAVTAVQTLAEGCRIFYAGCLELHAICGVHALGGGVDAVLDVVDCGLITEGENTGYYVDVAKDELAGFTPTCLLPVYECVSESNSGYVRLRPWPLFRAHEVLIRSHEKQPWDDCIREAWDWETYKACNLTAGICLDACDIPQQWAGGKGLIKSYCESFCDSVKVKYTAGFWPKPPKNLLDANTGIIDEICAECGKDAMKAESYKGYSYTRFTQAELAAIPYTFQATLRDYGCCS